MKNYLPDGKTCFAVRNGWDKKDAEGKENEIKPKIRPENKNKECFILRKSMRSQAFLTSILSRRSRKFGLVPLGILGKMVI